jgi:hypothetical protein
MTLTVLPVEQLVEVLLQQRLRNPAKVIGALPAPLVFGGHAHVVAENLHDPAPRRLPAHAVLLGDLFRTEPTSLLTVFPPRKMEICTDTRT